MNIEALKLDLISKIMLLKDDQKLKKVQITLKELSEDKEDIIQKLSKPMRKKLDIEELKKEQNFKPINKLDFFSKIDELNVEEPLEDLIRMI